MNQFNQRNEDFCNVVATMLRRPEVRTVKTAIRLALLERPRSLYVSPATILSRVGERRHRLPPREKPHRAKMWQEITDFYNARRNQCPGEPCEASAEWVADKCRPSAFFLTEEYATKLYIRVCYHHRRRG